MLRAHHFFFLLASFLSRPSLWLRIHFNLFFVFFLVGRSYATSTRSTRISSRGLVSPTIHPPIVIYFHIAVHSVV